MSSRLRRLVLTAHITCAVSWLGAVVGFLALAVAGLTSQDLQVVRSAYVAMELIARFVIVPLSFAPWVTGPILSLGTPWGLFRHYWIVAKLLITLLSTLILLIHMQPISHLASVAAEANLAGGNFLPLRTQMVIAAAAAVLALLVATTLAVYKPRGLTPYGLRRQRERRALLWRVD